MKNANTNNSLFLKQSFGTTNVRSEHRRTVNVQDVRADSRSKATRNSSAKVLFKKKVAAFSLLEMAITLTIISLLIAAVLTGQNIKRRQELYQVVTDISTIAGAVSQFKTNYTGFYPGDFYTSDTSIFPTSGNGNGYLETGSPNEELLFWQHLANAGLISGTYNGTTTGSGGLMEGPMKYSFYLAHKASGGRLNIQISKSDGAGVITAKEAYEMDVKYDDGNPGITDPVTTTAIITGADGTGETSGNCVNTTTSPDKYNATNTTGTPCALYWYLE